VKKDLSGLYASGGGDGPEAITAAMAEALQMQWRPLATKMIVLIADAPPHGIGEYGDGTIRHCLPLICSLQIQASTTVLQMGMIHYNWRD
jgi:hypothetical protein